ncbi:glycoprotein 38 family [Trichomonas vaginalis G3]|uniref:glycoprotein 38 family n=1 Tax=Trichomonas vaginalis (strain ATCC PRA-98 / G3) TaxID=412133 RepID=UPI0021E61708|nr:glycoprotein 38 family [Trichomonas vaginalis G3]KAI5512942.1 glycoprotein 38 family [Trichomonas vaginalis G3]
MITYNTQETLPSQLTFAFIINDVIAVHKTFDFKILTSPDIESITDANPNIEHKTNTRLTLNVRRRKADAMEDSIFKFEFVDQNVNQMSNPTIINNYKPKKVPNTDNDYTIRLIIPNNVEIGQKNLLIVIVDPSGQESSLFTIPITVTQGRIVTESSISCRKTQDMIPDGQEHLFKCNIDNIETYPVIYKAKIGRYESSFDSEFKHALRMEEVGYDNEFNVYVSIPEQTEEKTEISFAMINSNNEDIIKYCDITDIKIVPKPSIVLDSNTGFSELYARLPIEFKLNYICNFETLRVQYRDSFNNGDYQNVISISSLDENNIFVVKIVALEIREVEFKFIDEFDRYITIKYHYMVDNYKYYECNLIHSSPIQGEKYNFKCELYGHNPSAIAERKFYFEDYSDGNKYKLVNTSSEWSVKFSIELPIISEITNVTIHIVGVENPSIAQDLIVYKGLKPPLKIDFDVIETTPYHFKIGITASEETLYVGYIYHLIRQTSQAGEDKFLSSYFQGDLLYTEVYHYERFTFGEYNITIYINLPYSRVAKKTKLFKYDKNIIDLEVGRKELKNTICRVSAGYQVILSPISDQTGVNVYAEIGNKNYTLLQNNSIAVDFTQAGTLYCYGDYPISVIVLSISNIQADDIIYMIGNQKLTIGTSNNSNYKLEFPKSVVLVMGSFDGMRFSSHNEYNTAMVREISYNLTGNSQSSIRKILNVQNLLIYKYQWIDPNYIFDIEFETRCSQDYKAILINSKIGNYKFANENSNQPEEKPGEENPDGKNKPNGKESSSERENPGDKKPIETTPRGDDNSNSSDPPNKGKAGAIAGGIVGALIAIVIVCVIAFFIIKKKNLYENESSTEPIHETLQV